TRDTGDSQLAYQRESGRERQEQKIATFEQFGLIVLSNEPALSLTDDAETRRSVFLVRYAPRPAARDRFREGTVGAEQGDDVGERIHGRLIKKSGVLIIESPAPSVYSSHVREIKGTIP